MVYATRGTVPVSLDELPPAWIDFLGGELCAELANVQMRLAEVGDYYPRGSVLRAFHLCPPMALKAVVVGQDPYHGAGEANGLAFSFNGCGSVPPSLRNIYKELAADLAWPSPPRGGCLDGWAREGVLLINSILTVKPNEPGSHAKLGWEAWTDKVLAKISYEKTGVVYILWGAHARKKEKELRKGSLVVSGSHPSPLSANRGGFFGGAYFSRVNKMREALSLTP